MKKQSSLSSYLLHFHVIESAYERLTSILSRIYFGSVRSGVKYRLSALLDLGRIENIISAFKQIIESTEIEDEPSTKYTVNNLNLGAVKMKLDYLFAKLI